MIPRDLKRCLGQMIEGVQVVGASHDGVVRAYTSTWVGQVGFDEPILVASVSPKHDTHPLIVKSQRFSVSVLASDQIDVGQYFSYPGRKFRHVAEEYLEVVDGLPVVRNCIAWLHCEVLQQLAVDPAANLDHDLFLARATSSQSNRLREPPLLYSSRLGWRITGAKAREPGVSIRDKLLERLESGGEHDESVNDT